MSDPNAPRAEGGDPAEQPVDGFAVTDEQHAAPSAPAAPGVGEPAQSFSSPAVEPAHEAPSQPAFGSIDSTRAFDQSSGSGQPGAGSAPAAGGAGSAPSYGQAGGVPSYGQAGSAPSYGQTGSAPSYGQTGASYAPPGQGGPQYGAPGGPGQPSQQGYGQPSQQGYGQPGPQGYGQPGQPQYGAPGQPQYAASAPMSPIDEKNAGMWGHLSGLSTIVTGGFGGWVGPLIVFLIYKDRSAFARQEAREALNFGIFATILALGIMVVGFVLGIVTFGLGALLSVFWFIPPLLQVIFSIIGAMRVNAGGSYRYPFNWRMVS